MKLRYTPIYNTAQSVVIVIKCVVKIYRRDFSLVVQTKCGVVYAVSWGWRQFGDGIRDTVHTKTNLREALMGQYFLLTLFFLGGGGIGCDRLPFVSDFKERKTGVSQN
jgi:hypothetical protein